MIDEQRLQHAVDRGEIVNLISKSIIARDSGLWDDLAACYHSEAEFTTSWFKGTPEEFFRVAPSMLSRLNDEGGEQKHFTGNHWIEIAGDRAVAECDLILFMRCAIEGVTLDFSTWSRRLQLMAREKGAWKIWKRWVIYERDRMDPVDPTIEPGRYYDPKVLAEYGGQIPFHLWRNEVLSGTPPAKGICLKGGEQERQARAEAKEWMGPRSTKKPSGS